jgi:hypothetical protein
MNIVMELRKCCNHPFLIEGAEAQILRWAMLHDQRVTTSRGAHIPTAEHATMRGYGAASKMYSQMVRGHPTISLFASELCIGFTRWMGMHVLVSALMTMLGAPAPNTRVWSAHTSRMLVTRTQWSTFGFTTPRVQCAATRRTRCWAASPWPPAWALQAPAQI